MAEERYAFSRNALITSVAGSPDCEKLTRDLLSGLNTNGCEVDQEGIRNVIAEGAFEQWMKLQKNIPKKDCFGPDDSKLMTKDGAADSEAGLRVLDDFKINQNGSSSLIIRSLDPKPQDLEEFVLEVLYSFKPIYLQKSAEYSTGSDGRLVEGAWQKEFYRAATTILPSGMYISPEANTTFGKVDFYVHTQDKKIKWCIDLVREGDLLDEHVQKFEKRDEGEQLSDKPSKKGADCDDYMILDFREAGKIGVDEEKAKSYAKVWFANYSEAFTSISVSCFEPTTSKLRTIKTIKLPEEGHEQCSAFERLQREIILKCKDEAIANLCAQLTARTAEPGDNSQTSCSNENKSVFSTGIEGHTQSSTQPVEQLLAAGNTINQDEDNLDPVNLPDTKEVLPKATIEGYKWLDDEDINKVMGLLKIQFPHLSGLHDCLIGHSHQSFPKTEGTFLQILYVNGNHWITVQYAPQSPIVNVYDSIYSSASYDAKRQIAALLRTNDERIVLKFHKTQYQKECTDCGVFAVAFAIDLAYGFNPSRRRYTQQDLRPHLAKCLFEQKMTPFPAKVKKNPGHPLTEDIEVFCTCRLPDAMVKCSKCTKKYHASCIRSAPSWKCSTCENV